MVANVAAMEAAVEFGSSTDTILLDDLLGIATTRNRDDSSGIIGDASRRLLVLLATMRKLAAGTDQLAEVDAFITGLREIHRRRPRLQQEFDRARLP